MREAEALWLGSVVCSHSAVDLPSERRKRALTCPRADQTGYKTHTNLAVSPALALADECIPV